jgi:NAD(P)-dependent dehydrogenase (short-subunit alcohol dehydrogenase family)
MGLATAAGAAAAGAKVTIASSDQSRLDAALGAVTAVKHAAPRIKAGGSIVLTSGIIAVRPSAGAALMAGGAAATEGLTRGLAVDLAPVRVNAVRPGAIHTSL